MKMIIDIIKNPNSEKYPDQYMYLTNYKNYIYVVPHIKKEEKQEIFLETIFPSRFYTRRYLPEGKKNGRI